MLLLIPDFSAVLPIVFNGWGEAAGEDTQGLSESLNLRVGRRYFSALKIGEVLILSTTSATNMVIEQVGQAAN